MEKHWSQAFNIEYNEDFYICKCSNNKGLNIDNLPEFYKNSILSWSEVQNKLAKYDKKKIILDANLFGNRIISIRNTPLFYSSFSKSYIKTVRDMYDENNNSFHSNDHIHEKLIDKRSLRLKYNKIKTKIFHEVG